MREEKKALFRQYDPNRMSKVEIDFRSDADLHYWSGVRTMSCRPPAAAIRAARHAPRSRRETEVPTNIGLTRSAPTAVAVSGGRASKFGLHWAALRIPFFFFFFFYYFNTSSGVGTSRHQVHTSDIGRDVSSDVRYCTT